MLDGVSRLTAASITALVHGTGRSAAQGFLDVRPDDQKRERGQQEAGGDCDGGGKPIAGEVGQPERRRLRQPAKDGNREAVDSFGRLRERRNNPFTLSVFGKSAWASMGLLNKASRPPLSCLSMFS